ncbi:PD-(D/E)XK motif protein [Sphingomicrobium clamense]|uniref:PD-(D/E)XK motif protein n=1 Tax=Sphingomicrobium clamense TaxID=2851013 RepID=A0ABS6V9F2_9SPHN|nr:PD-(D/E)XK motif protein [Sphingomicrobium sp. B8]MBW0145777.1 PD-(D/E)XK motif protein [Sphingomicrobium sp. B8]
MTPEELEEIWIALEHEGRTEAGWHVRKLRLNSTHQLMAGRRAPSGTVGVLYEVASSAVPGGTAWPDGKGFNTSIETISPGRGGKIRIALELTNPQYRDLFGALCLDIVSVITEASDVSTGVSAFVRRLQAWQRFMQLHSSGGLSQEQLRGIFSEISFLETTLLPALGPGAAVECWQGRGGLQDFLRENVACEVKSSTSAHDPTVMISRLDQLDERPFDHLFLAFVPLRNDQRNGISLPDLVNRVREKLASDVTARSRLDEQLTASGYHDAQATRYETPKFICGDTKLYRVADDFPRLSEAIVAPGITSAKYGLRLSACEEYEISNDEFLGLFTGCGENGNA